VHLSFLVQQQQHRMDQDTSTSNTLDHHL
jgi:hypothetical protein